MKLIRMFILFRQVQLMNKMRTDCQKGRKLEAERNKEISQLKKEQRIKDSAIKQLEADKKQKDLILKRKQEEVKSVFTLNLIVDVFTVIYLFIVELTL